MVSAIREHVTVQAGGRIEIPASELPAGAEAEVIVVLEQTERRSGSLLNMLGKGKGCFTSPEAADAFIRRERDAWDL